MALLTDLRGKIKDYWKDKYDERTGDGSKTIWKLSKAPLTSQVVTVGTATYTENNQYRIDKDTGIITFLSGAPANNTGWTVTYQYATFSDAQMYTFLNNGIKACNFEICNDVETNMRKMERIETCEATAGWSKFADAADVVQDASNYKYGTYGLDLPISTIVSASASWQKSITATNINNYEYLNFWLLVKDPTILNDRGAVEARLGYISGSSSANYLTYTWNADKLTPNAWSHLSVAIADMSAVGSVVNSAINYIGIGLIENPVNKETTSTADIVMDDWRLSQFPIASTNTKDYTLPARWFHVNRAELYNTDNAYLGKIVNFETFGNELRIDEDLQIGNPIKLYGSQEFDTLYASGSYTSDMPRQYEEMVVNHAAAEALESMLVDRTRYTAYSTNVTPQGASVGSLQNASILYRKLFQDDYNKFNNASHATEISPALDR